MKGQTFIDYLMTYGWAILIILIVAGILVYYGIFNQYAFSGIERECGNYIDCLNLELVLEKVDCIETICRCKHRL